MPSSAISRALDSQRTLLAGRLAISATHEIINPVSAVLSLAALMQHLLKEDPGPLERLDELRSYLSQIIHETSRAGRLASELLTFSRASGGKIVRANLNEIVDRTLSLASHVLKVADVSCETRLAEDLPVIRCDRDRLQQVILNILVNAVDAVADCPVRRITVETRTSADGGSVVLEIKDTGTGIPPERMSHIFEPFFTTLNRPESPGLGLAVSRRIIEDHKGVLQVSSDGRSETTATITLPAGQAHNNTNSGGSVSRGRG